MRRLLGIGGAIALMAAIYFGTHSRGPGVDVPAEPPRPEPGAPPVKESAPAPAVTARTDGTDNSLRELRECIYAAHELARAKHLMDCSFYEGKPEYQKALADCMEGPMDAHNRKAAAETVLAHCDVTDLIEGIGQRDTQYKMTKLLRLGATGKYARNLDSELHGFKHPDLEPSAALPPEVTTEGDAWAQETYNNYFSGVPGLTERPVICAQ